MAALSVIIEWSGRDTKRYIGECFWIFRKTKSNGIVYVKIGTCRNYTGQTPRFMIRHISIILKRCIIGRRLLWVTLITIFLINGAYWVAHHAQNPSRIVPVGPIPSIEPLPTSVIAHIWYHPFHGYTGVRPFKEIRNALSGTSLFLFSLIPPLLLSYAFLYLHG